MRHCGTEATRRVCTSLHLGIIQIVLASGLQDMFLFLFMARGDCEVPGGEQTHYRGFLNVGLRFHITEQ
jgi:hypothetical protein